MKLFLLCLFIPFCFAHEPIILEGIPHVKQRPDFCGEACVEMWCKKLEHPLDQDDVFNFSGLAPEEGRGCYTRELARALKEIGFDTGDVDRWISADKPVPEMDKAFLRIVKGLQNDYPSIVCMRYNESKNTTEHFRLIVGYDKDKDEVVFHEPAEEDGAYRRMSRRQFYRLWPLKYRTSQWLLVQFDLKSKKLKDARESRDAEIAQHVRKTREMIKAKAPGSEFHLQVREPFVIFGDERPLHVKARADQTVDWAARKLKAQFFRSEPKELINVWLFKDKASYEDHMWKFWETKPFTPYGYFSSEHQSLVMNIATGGGTLVHEVVHPFIRADFPGCASWVDEGIASLFEQSSERRRRIVGLTNWRLHGLQRAIERDRVPSFKTLCATTRDEFYEQDPGTNYSQSRYLMYYLQEKGLLEDFYANYREDRKIDPTGWKTLQKILGNPDMTEWQAGWEKWVMTLEFK